MNSSIYDKHNSLIDAIAEIFIELKKRNEEQEKHNKENTNANSILKLPSKNMQPPLAKRKQTTRRQHA